MTTNKYSQLFQQQTSLHPPSSTPSFPSSFEPTTPIPSTSTPTLSTSTSSSLWSAVTGATVTTPPDPHHQWAAAHYAMNPFNTNFGYNNGSNGNGFDHQSRSAVRSGSNVSSNANATTSYLDHALTSPNMNSAFTGINGNVGVRYTNLQINNIYSTGTL